MKKVTKLFLASLFSVALLSTSSYADTFKGGRIFSNAVENCPMLMPDLAGTHLKKEWKQIVDDGKLVESIQKVCPKATVKPIKQEDMKDVLDYLQYYSRGGGALPAC